MALNDNESEALSAWGAEAYRAIPKSVFATVAWHLANVASGTADEPGAAELRFLEEWHMLRESGFNLSSPTKALREALVKRAIGHGK